MRAIDARSIDRLRIEHCRTFLLNFRDPQKEAKYVKEKDRMLNLYFFCSVICFLTILVIRFLNMYINLLSILIIIPFTIILTLIPIVVYMENSKTKTNYFKISRIIHRNRNVAQLVSFIMASSMYALVIVQTISLPDEISLCNITLYQKNFTQENTESLPLNDEDCNPYIFLDYLLLLVLISMIACAVYQVLISLLKTIILLFAMIGYIVVYINFNMELQLIYTKFHRAR
ncbi:hypothetical protein AMK59_6094 [Oryctes borbonicus]|uniref:Adenylate cyclase conserved domain-containing protein n=1 Tax=Oryctes borbonicus TaxID=1629725 RepID=A0A0T6B256_9SCAR|nr:hypothetical protein AMK59_6094 [Oryctes borbonicus]